MLTMKDFDYYNKQSDDVFGYYEDQDEQRNREVRRTRRIVKDTLGDDQVEYREWNIFNN